MAFVYTHRDDKDNLLEFGTKEWRFGLWFDSNESGWYFVSASSDAECGVLSDEVKQFLCDMAKAVNNDNER